jgi:hypothetical protein
MALAPPWPKGAATAAALVMGMEGGGGGTHPTGSGGAGMEDGGLDIGCGRCLRVPIERRERESGLTGSVSVSAGNLSVVHMAAASGKTPTASRACGGAPELSWPRRSTWRGIM